MGKETAPDFADVLSYTIAHHYDSAEHFAAEAEVATSSVSRWCNRKGSPPSVRLIQRMAPFIRDSRGRAISASQLINLAYPDVAAGHGARVSLTVQEVRHPLARELDQMLDDDSSIPVDKRRNLESVAESVIAPYRTYMRKRKAS